MPGMKECRSECTVCPADEVEMCGHFGDGILVFANRLTGCRRRLNLPEFWVGLCHKERHIPFCEECGYRHFCMGGDDGYFDTDDYAAGEAEFRRREGALLGREA